MIIALGLAETIKMFRFVAHQIIANEDLLSEADRAIGDGDHGVGMTRGFEAVLLKLDREEFEDLSSLLDGIGTSLISSIGGASGIIFGTWFRSGAKELSGKRELDGWSVMQFLHEGLKGIQMRSKAIGGDKTMLDVLIPAGAAAERSFQGGLEATLNAVALAAEQGVENTKAMIAKVGRAKTLGERSIGYPDPGALSACLILSAMNRFLNDHR